ncbi:MAG: aldo/keto reductase [Bacteroidales bacterium]|nr:aldo/keto reductase [Bacteroidales bacterium]
MQNVKLNCGIDMPIIGYGVYMVDPSVTERCVLDALSVGYRSLDTAQYYENEAMVGSAVRKSGVPRDEVFITSKLCQSRPTYAQAKENVKGSLRRMRLDYLDLMLIHWPMGNDGDIWAAFEDLVKEGYLRSIGVSNFYPGQFDKLVREASMIPAVNQIETHVFYQQRPMISKMADAGTVVESWGPLAEGLNGIFTNPVLTEVGAAHGKTAAQVALRFLTQQGIIVIPKSVHKERMIQNLDTLDFDLSQDEMAAIRCLDTGHNLEGWPSDALKYNPETVV